MPCSSLDRISSLTVSRTRSDPPAVTVTSARKSRTGCARAGIIATVQSNAAAIARPLVRRHQGLRGIRPFWPAKEVVDQPKPIGLHLTSGSGGARTYRTPPGCRTSRAVKLLSDPCKSRSTPASGCMACVSCNSTAAATGAALRDGVRRSLRDTIEHQANRRDIEHGFRRLNTMLVLFRQASIKTKPREIVLTDPCQPSDLKGTLLALDDLSLPAVTTELSGEFAALVARIRDDRGKVGQSGANPAGNLEPATESGMFAGSTRLAIGMPSISARIRRFAPLRACAHRSRGP
jgi:hypothetical protein